MQRFLGIILHSKREERSSLKMKSSRPLWRYRQCLHRIPECLIRHVAHQIAHAPPPVHRRRNHRPTFDELQTHSSLFLNKDRQLLIRRFRALPVSSSQWQWRSPWREMRRLLASWSSRSPAFGWSTTEKIAASRDNSCDIKALSTMIASVLIKRAEKRETDLIGNTLIIFVSGLVKNFVYGSEIHSQACFPHRSQQKWDRASGFSLWDA